ncbi:hypothetical protein N7524_001106 [Penicillium chrysogenum]|nr:hypothetical protein N7524_001106 [Penicillium chrysogenum]
MTNSEDDNAVR